MILIMKIKLQIVLSILFIISFQNKAGSEPIISSNEIFHPVIAESGMVASDNRQATEAGIHILKRGGNAIDAAVTVGFTMAATYQGQEIWAVADSCLSTLPTQSKLLQ